MATVYRNGIEHRTFSGPDGGYEKAIGFVADQTGKAREHVAEEMRNGWPIINDRGDQTEWRIE